jgi:Cdc6-like AAA superfamily ATPase
MKGNPFTITFGKEPNLLISRGEETDRIVSVFTSENPLTQSFLIEGIRGSGKTVLMTTVGKQLEEDDDWIVVNLNSSRDLLEDLARSLSNAVKGIPDLFKHGVNVSVAGFGFGIGASEEHPDSVSIIEDILKALKKKGRKLLITIDEVIHDENMRIFASEFQIFLRDDYPVFLIMTGLYENLNSIQNDPQLTFLLRSPKINLSPLSIPAIVREYEEALDIDEETAKELAHATKGYAFAFQALGALYFENRDKLPVSKIINKLDGILDEFVYRKIWEGLTEIEKKFLLAMDDEHSFTAAEICEKAGIKKSSIPKYKERLINIGIIHSPEYGKAELSLPRFEHVIRLY